LLQPIADFPLWLDVASFIDKCAYGQNRRESKDWNMHIANFLENNDNSSAIDFDSLQKLTNKKVLPTNYVVLTTMAITMNGDDPNSLQLTIIQKQDVESFFLRRIVQNSRTIKTWEKKHF